MMMMLVASVRGATPLRSFLLFVLALTASCLLDQGNCSPSVSVQKPNFVGVIPNVTVTQGRDASLPCVVKDIGDYQVTWMHLNRVMLLTIDKTTITLIPRFRVTRDDHSTWTLHIQDVHPEDTGYYVCQVNMEPVINQVGYLQVVVPPQFVDEESSPSHVSVQESNDVRLVCRATGVPKPTIRWTREDALPITTAKGTKVDQIDSMELLLKGVTRKDMGAYLCIARNKVPPSISKRIVLEVQFQPHISVPTQLVGAPVGTAVTLECKVAAFPNAVHFWRFNDQLLINSSRQETREIQEGYTTTMKLSLNAIKTSDFGTYICAAKNSLGETESNVRLYEINVHRGSEKKQDVSSHNNELIPPEQHKDTGSLEGWDKPNEFRSDLDAGSPSYTLEDFSMRGRGPVSPLGGAGTSLGTSGRTGYGPHSDSNSASREDIANRVGMWGLCLAAAYIWGSCIHLATNLPNLSLLVLLLLLQIITRVITPTVVIHTLAGTHT